MSEPEQIGNVLERLLARPLAECGTCARCLKSFEYLKPQAPEPQHCVECARKVEDGAAILEQLEEHVARVLARAGLAPIELAADLRKIPVPILVRLPQETLRVMLRGDQPPAGFGIIGPSGIGKTMALAALFAETARARIRARAAIDGAAALSEWLLWLPWPETVNRFRVTSLRDRGVLEVNGEVERAIHADVLVLDDIAAERIRGSFSDDPAASRLDLIADGRHRAMRPTFFTSNYGEITLRERYGDRLVRRLTQGVDVVALPG